MPGHMEAIDVVREAGVDLEPKELDFNPKSFFNKRKPKQADKDSQSLHTRKIDRTFGSIKTKTSSVKSRSSSISTRPEGADSPAPAPSVRSSKTVPSTKSSKKSTKSEYSWTSRIIGFDPKLEAAARAEEKEKGMQARASSGGPSVER